MDEVRDCLDTFSAGKLTLPLDTHAVSLVAPDEQALLMLEQTLIENKIPHAAIREPDAPWNNQLLAIGVVPCERILVKKILQKFSTSK